MLESKGSAPRSTPAEIDGSPDVLNCHRGGAGDERSDGLEDEAVTRSGEAALQEEKQEKEQLQRELETQQCINNETATAMKLLEKDIHEKQDTIISLRRQLEDIKSLNLQLYNKTQTYELSLKTKDTQIAQNEQKLAALTKSFSQLENK